MNLLDLAVRIVAKDEASDKVESIGSGIVGKLGKAVAGVAKFGAAATAAVAGAAVAVGKMAIDNYGEFEQLAGGAKLMFGSAYDYIERRSQEAYKNVQMSQNDYLQQVNGFAVGLKTALGGNEQAAAELADKIVTAEADIVAATGNTQENIQNAFNGIMKSNFSMLDNLGLGITPTKEGFQEVIDKVNEWNDANGRATSYQIDNLADCQSALVDYIEMQGMAGYAANEGATTLQGATETMKASWKNLLTEMGKDGGNVGKRMQELVDSTGNLLFGSVNATTGAIEGGLFPRIRQIISNVSANLPSIMSSIGKAMQKALPEILGVITDLLPVVIQIVGGLVMGLGSALPGILATVVPILVDQITNIISTISDSLPQILDTIGQIVMAVAMAIAQNGPHLVVALVGLLASLVAEIIGHLPEFVSGAGQVIMAMLTGIKEEWPKVKKWWSELPGNIVKAIANIAARLLPKGRESIQGALNGVKAAWPTLRAWFASLPSKILSAIGSLAGTLVGKGRDAINGMRNGASAAFGSLRSFVAGIPGRIRGAIGSVGGLLYGAGSAIMNGLKSGIVSAAQGVYNYVSGIAAKIKSLKGPLPYDRQVLVENGEALMYSLYKGLSVAFEGRVLPYVRTMAGTISNSIGTPTMTVTAGARQKAAPVLNLTIERMTVSDRDDAEYYARRTSEIWAAAIRGSL